MKNAGRTTSRRGVCPEARPTGDLRIPILGSLAERLKAILILVVCAHPDDAELGAGGSIAQFARLGYRVVVVFLSRGNAGGSPRVREAESRRACAALGVRRSDVHFGVFKDTCIPSDHRTIAYLEGFYDRLRPALVLTHSEHDVHQDHVAVARASITSFRRVPRLLSFEAPSATADFRPAAFIDITGTIEIKARSLACHRSQIRKCMSLEYGAMQDLATFRGHQAGVARAEAFEVQRFLLPLLIA